MIYTLLSIAVIGRITEKKWLNPITVLFFMWSGIIYLSKLQLFGLYATNNEYYYLIFWGLISFFIGYYIYLFFQRKRDKDQENIAFCLNYKFCYFCLILSILISALKLLDYGFDFSQISLDYSKFSEINRSSYNSRFINFLYEFIAYPIFNSFIIISVGDFFFGKKDKRLLILTGIMLFFWMLVTGGRIAVIRLSISILVFLSFSNSTNKLLKNIVSKVRFVIVLFILCLIFLYITIEKGFDLSLNLYTDFAIQPKMFEFWALSIGNQKSYGAASLFGFIYPFAYVVKNFLGLSQFPFGLQIIYDNINNTYLQWMKLGTYFKCNAYVSAFWYLYYDAREFGIIIGMMIWGLFSKKFFNEAIEKANLKNVSMYSLFLIGIVYTFTDMEFAKANYVIAFFIIGKLCFLGDKKDNTLLKNKNIE